MQIQLGCHRVNLHRLTMLPSEVRYQYSGTRTLGLADIARDVIDTHM